LRDEDLRTQLAEAAPVWEVERILACETPDQVSPVVIVTIEHRIVMSP
jgi:hypothetical protein